MNGIASLILIVSWVVGIVLAKGFWSTTFAILIVPYAWYLVVEKIMIINGWMQ